MTAGAAIATALSLGGFLPPSAVPAIAVASAAAAIDLHEHRLPRRWVALTAVTAALATTVAASERGAGVLASAVVVAAVAGGALLAVHLAAPAALGFGDVTFAVALAPLTAGHHPSATLLVVALWGVAASGTTLVLALARRRAVVAFGPGLLVGAVVAHITHPVVGP